MRLVTLLCWCLLVSAGLDLLLAQEVAWGLALFHVDSGLWGPFLLCSAAVCVIVLGVSAGSLAKK